MIKIAKSKKYFENKQQVVLGNADRNPFIYISVIRSCISVIRSNENFPGPTWNLKLEDATWNLKMQQFFNKSMRCIKAVTVELNKRLHHVGDGEAGGGGGPGAWLRQPAPY